MTVSRPTQVEQPIKSKKHAQEKSQDVAEAQDSTLPTTSAERDLLTSVAVGGTKIAGKLATGKSFVAAIQLRLQHQIED